jgi:hypothetical protein
MKSFIKEKRDYWLCQVKGGAAQAKQEYTVRWSFFTINELDTWRWGQNIQSLAPLT